MNKNIERNINATAVGRYFLGTPIKLLGWGLALIIIAILLKPTIHAAEVTNDWPQTLAHELSRDLGIAFVVACGIALAVEQNAKEEIAKTFERFSLHSGDLMHDISNKTLESYFKRELPDGWHEYLRDSIKSSLVMRNESHISLSIHNPTANERKEISIEKFIMSELSISYEIANITNDPVNFSAGMHINLLGKDYGSEFVNVLDFEIDDKPLSPEQLEKAKAEPNSQHHYVLKHELLLSKGAHVRVYIRVRAPRSPSDTLIYVQKEPGQGLQVTVSAAEGLWLGTRALHPKYATRPMLEVSNGKTNTIKTDTPVPPFTPIVFTWESPDPTEAATAKI